jgi:hypothetical protein
VKILKEIIKLRKQDQDERDEHDSLLDVYMRAMDVAGPAPVALFTPFVMQSRPIDHLIG